MNLAFYVYFYGSNDNAACRIPILPSLKYDCYYFTNNKTIFELLENTGWIRVFDDKPTTDDLIESCMVGKHIKALPHEYQELSKYDYLCYFDSKINNISETIVENLINKYCIEQNYALLLRLHFHYVDGKATVFDEYNVSLNQYRYTLEADKYMSYINKQLSKGFSHETNNHCACGYLIRNMKHEKINEINNVWYQNIQECGIQDQISFFFVYQQYNDYIYPFSENIV